MAKVLMVQGTMSGAGKSLLVAGLCRIFRQDGYRVAPFKSQNMALNSFVTAEGLEMGRAQVMQAEAAKMMPTVRMNPILLKPTGHMGSQVIVNGEVLGNMGAMEYFQYKQKLMPTVLDAFRSLEREADIIVVEGAGSPAEINLRENDIVNMGLAQALDAPVLLAGDIDRGGVFAQLLGTLLLFSEEERTRTMGLIINKFRGDMKILEPGIHMLQERAGKPVVGVVPFMELDIEEEDSLTERFDRKKEGAVRIAVIRYPCIANFTDVAVFERMPDVSVRYVTDAEGLAGADLILLPGSKNTMGDLRWLRRTGLEATIRERSGAIPVVGICGGYQMLGEKISDPDCVEEGGEMAGMGLLPVLTLLKREKTRTQCAGEFARLPGILAPLSGKKLAGYEIHMGETLACKAGEEGCALPVGRLHSEQHSGVWADGACGGNIYGTYVHGVFDEGDVAETLIRALAERKGVAYRGGALPAYRQYREQQYDRLAQGVRDNLDMEAVYAMLREAAV